MQKSSLGDIWQGPQYPSDLDKIFDCLGKFTFWEKIENNLKPGLKPKIRMLVLKQKTDSQKCSHGF